MGPPEPHGSARDRVCLVPRGRRSLYGSRGVPRGAYPALGVRDISHPQMSALAGVVSPAGIRVLALCREGPLKAGC